MRLTLATYNVYECVGRDGRFDPERTPRVLRELDACGAGVRVVATHLGLRPAERRAQMRRLLVRINDGAAPPLALMGDLNERFLWGRPLRAELRLAQTLV